MRSLGNAYKNFVGAWTIQAPNNAAPLTVQSYSTYPGLVVQGSSGFAGYLDLIDGQTGVQNWQVQSGYPTPGTFAINKNGSGASLQISSVGNVSVAAPTSGTAFTATAVSSQYAAVFNGGAGYPTVEMVGAASTGAQIRFVDGNTGNRQYSVGVSVSTTGSFEIYDATAGAQRLAVSSTGAVTIPTPTSGTAISANGVAGSNTAYFTGSATSGQSYGMNISAGTTSADYAMYVGNQAGSVPYLKVAGDGGVEIGNPTGGTEGLGTLNIQAGLYVAGNPIYVGIPQNSQTSNYTFVLSDANKHILHASGTAHTFTIPANSSVAYPIGTAITIVNGGGSGVITLAITSDTLTWTPSGATGSRSLAATSVCTILKVTSTIWYLSGNGIT